MISIHQQLEEFRKKKAADRAKKASSTSQIHASEVNLNEKRPLETEHLRVTDTNGAGTSDGLGKAVSESSSIVINSDSNSIDSAQKSELVLSSDTQTGPFLSNDYNSFSSDQTQKNGHEFGRYGDLGSGGPLDVYQSHGKKGNSNDVENYAGGLGRPPYGTASDQSFALRSKGSQDFDSSISQLSFHRIDEPQLKEEKTPSKDYTIPKASSQVSVARISSQNSISTAFPSEPSSAGGSRSSSYHEDISRPTANRRGFADDNTRDNVNSDFMSSRAGKENISSTASGLFSMENEAVQTFGSVSFESNFRSSLNHAPLYPLKNETNSRRSRPSFLDNLNIPKSSSESHFGKDGFEKDSFMPNSLRPKSIDFLGSSPFHKPSMDAESLGLFSKVDSLSTSHAYEPSMNSVSDSMVGDPPKLSVNENGIEWKHEFLLPKQNEDFAALEQHIEDLTQEKFSLQRALEASRSLAESLAAENSSLTDSFNQQRGVVDQLKSDMEKLQEEIKAKLVELEAVRNEYANAQLECNAADERAKLLASEVISLEEKALRLRSNELKLEKQLESSQAEISSYKKKMSSLEKDRLDLQSTIDALQEEKKLLQSKLWKAATSRSVDLTKSTTNKKDVSTTTEDLENEDTVTETSSRETRDSSFVETDAFSSSMFPRNGYSTTEALFANLPLEQSRMIQNINILISELALEKQELIQALTSESSYCSKLKELNNELSRKLEAQTQRLELLTAQSMASVNISVRQPDSHDMHVNIQYADEGDEVVERVLGWIMKLFPGGPSRRRTSRLL